MGKRISLETIIGKEQMQECGQMCKIIAAESFNNIKVQFEDGRISEHVSYKAFRNGGIAHPTKVPNRKPVSHVGEQYTLHNGTKVVIVASEPGRTVSVQFPDGAIRSGVLYDTLSSGVVAHPSKMRNK